MALLQITVDSRPMKKIAVVIMSSVLLWSTPVSAMQPEKKFKNCTELRKKYPNGVAKSAKAAGSTGAKVSLSIYNANKSSDRDKDGIACEQGK